MKEKVAVIERGREVLINLFLKFGGLASFCYLTL